MIKTKEETNSECQEKGDIVLLEYIPLGRIKSILRLTEQDETVLTHLEKSTAYTLRYRLIYDILHELTQALLLCDCIKSRNHYCLFAKLCVTYPEFDWNFFEVLRKKRNGIAYYGEEVSQKDLDEIYATITKYMKILREETERRTKELEKRI